MSISVSSASTVTNWNDTSLANANTINSVPSGAVSVFALWTYIDYADSTPTFSVSDGSNSYSVDVVGRNGSGQASGIAHFDYTANSAGNKTVTVTPSGTSGNDYGRLLCVYVTGLSSSSFDKSGTGNNTSTTPTCVIGTALSTSNEVIFSVLGSADNSLAGATTPPTSSQGTFTNLLSDLTGSSIATAVISYSIVSATTAPSVAWGTISSSTQWNSCMATYKAATASVAFRKTLSPLGTRIGSRQIQL